MSVVEDTIEVNVPVRTAYDQWTQFESFPQFMEGVKSVRQLDDTRLVWDAEIYGRDKHWEAKIDQQQPDKLVSWRSTTGAKNDGIVRFESLGGRTQIQLRIDADPDGLIENVGDHLGLLKRQVHEDLERFKKFIESSGSATGGWRGEIQGGRSEASGSTPDATGSGMPGGTDTLAGTEPRTGGSSGSMLDGAPDLGLGETTATGDPTLDKTAQTGLNDLRAETNR